MIESITLKKLFEMKPNNENSEYDELQKKLKMIREEISEMANKVTMEFNNEIVDFTISNEWKKLTPNVIGIECALNDDCCTVINMKFKKDGIIYEHKHTRQEEIFVVSGSIYDFVNDIKTEQGGVYVIPPNKLHGLKSDKANITVVYRPPFPTVKIVNG
jgi:quercetin dioxygenase-like cupin family protein